MSEWELRVSQREIHRMHVVRLTIEGRETVGRGAKLLGISPRQMKRLRRKLMERGDFYLPGAATPADPL
jgi:transposase-like protein